MLNYKTIVLAEDNPKDVELTLEALKENNLVYHVITVKDGVETLEYLRGQGKFKNRKPGNPTVLFLDIKMPRKDGFEVLREIRNDTGLKLLPVVMLTSSREEKDLYISYSLGVNAYVVKPVDFSSFEKIVMLLGTFWGTINETPPYGKLMIE